MPEDKAAASKREAEYSERQKKVADHLVSCKESFPELIRYALNTPDPMSADSCPVWAHKKKGGASCQIM